MNNKVRALFVSVAVIAPITARAGCSKVEWAVNPGGCAAKEAAERAGVPSPPTLGDLVPGGPERVEQIGNDVIKTAKTASNDTVRELTRAGGDVIKTVQKTHEDTARTVLKGAKDIEANYTKAWRDTAKQTEGSLRDAADAAKAVERYQSREFQDQVRTLNKAAKQLQDGKVIDAMWTTSVEKAHGTEDNFFKATQESAVLSAAAQAAAATYGGPAGAAAYAAWATYKATGDVSMALRAGAVAAISSQAGAGVDKMPTGTLGEVLKKSAMAGAAGGIAVAAAGGDEKAVKDAFLKSAGNVVIQRGQDRLQAYSPKAKNAIDTIQCISAKNTDCFSNLSYVKDAKGRLMKELPTQKIDPKQYVGQWSRLDPNSPAGKAAALVTQVSKLPKSEMIPMMNNEWVMTWTLGSNGNLEPNKPTVVLTYVGKNKPFQSTARYSRVQPRKAAPVGPRKSAPVAVGNPSATTATRATNFACQVPHGATRRVVVTSTGRSCEAVYLRESRPTTQVIYRTPSNGSICTQKAYEFMADLGRKGVQCRPR